MHNGGANSPGDADRGANSRGIGPPRETVVVIGAFAESLVRFRGQLLRDLRDRGFRVIGCAPDIDARVGAQLKELGVEAATVPMRRGSTNPLSDLGTFVSLYQVFRATKPGVVISYTIKPVIYGSMAARVAGVRRVASIITGLGTSFSRDTLRQRMTAWLVAELYRLALRVNQAIAFQNPDDLEMFRQCGLIRPGVSTAVVGGSGIDLDAFGATEVPSAPCFLMVSRLILEKGIVEYCEAASQVRRRHPDARFLIAGWIDERNPSAIGAADFEALVRDNGVEFIGRVDDVRPLLRESSVFVLPTYYREGIPRTLLEALASGRAVITTDTPGCRETVVPGVNGLLVPPRDATALANAMATILDRPGLSASMGQASRRLAERRFDVREVNAALLRLILSAANGKERAR